MLLLPLLLLLQAPEPQNAGLFPVTRSATRGGSSLVAVSAPQTPWAVAQLHIRLVPEEQTPKARAATLQWAQQLAEAGRKSVGPNGTVEFRVQPDSVVFSFGVEAAKADDALRAVDAALRARSQKPAANAPPVVIAGLVVVDDGVGEEAARVLFAGSGLSLPISGGVLDAANAKALGDAVTAERVALVFVAPDEGAALLARMNKIVTAPLSKAGTSPAAAGVRPGGKAVFELPPAGKPSSTVTWLIPPRVDGSGLLVLASLLGGRPVKSLGTMGVAVDVSGADRAALLAAEEDALEQMRRIAAAPPPPEVVEEARAKVSAARLAALTDPGKVAHALGQAALDGRPTRTEDDVAALASSQPQHVSLAAAALGQAFVVIVRQPGEAAAAAP